MNVQRARFQEAPANLEAITNERDFQTQVVDALRYMGWVVIHVAMMQQNQPGIPDLLCFRDGRGLMIELKVGRNPLSKGQRAWQERWLPEGTEVYVVRNTEEDWERLMGLAL